MALNKLFLNEVFGGQTKGCNLWMVLSTPSYELKTRFNCAKKQVKYYFWALKIINKAIKLKIMLGTQTPTIGGNSPLIEKVVENFAINI